MANKCIPITKEADLDRTSNPDTDSDVSKIAAVREAWNAAVKANDANRLAAFVTDDVVFVRGNGRCDCGKEELKADFQKRFARFDSDRRFSSAKIIVRGETDHPRYAVPDRVPLTEKLHPRSPLGPFLDG
jgi:hypothetical protein